MLFCQLGQARSLREICGGRVVKASGSIWAFLGPPTNPRWPMPMSTGPGSCIRRSSAFYLLVASRQRGTRHGFRFRNPLLSIDGTIIELCATMFDWAKYHQTKGTANLHLP